MALLRNTAEGQASGTTVSGSNSGGSSGSAFVSAFRNGSATAIFSNEQAMHGSQSYKLTCNTTTGDIVTLLYNGAGDMTGAIQIYVYLTAYPTTNSFKLMEGYNSSRSSGGLSVDSSGHIIVADTLYAQLTKSVTTVPLSTWVRFDLLLNIGTTTTNGRLAAQMSIGDSVSSTWSYDSGVAVNTGTDPMQSYRTGKLDGSAMVAPFYVDDVAANPGATNFMSPATATNIAPVANAGSDQANLEPYKIVTLSGTDSDSDGTVTSRQWRQVSGTPVVTLQNATSATATYVAPGTISGTTLTFGYTVTDNGGTPSTESTVTNTIYPATERAVMGGTEVPMHTLVAQSGGLV